jgi:hypothetical protein
MSINQGSLITATDVNNHINDKNNLHGIASSYGCVKITSVAIIVKFSKVFG